MCVKVFSDFFFNWRIIVLENFFVFSQLSTWVSHKCIYMSPSSWSNLFLKISSEILMGFPDSSAGIKNLPAMQETPVRFLGQEDPLEKGKATHSSILAWRIPWRVHGVAKSWTGLSNFHSHFHRDSYKDLANGSSQHYFWVTSTVQFSSSGRTKFWLQW